MPSVSEAQNRAMHAAEEGRSTLGIPQKVGVEFVRADKGRKIGDLPRHVAPKTQRYVMDGRYRRVKS